VAVSHPFRFSLGGAPERQLGSSAISNLILMSTKIRKVVILVVPSCESVEMAGFGGSVLPAAPLNLSRVPP
jgi:hypothetical protein